MKREKADLLQGTLDLIVLKLLRAGPANGWDLTQSIQLVSKGALNVNYGSMYPALRRLEASAIVWDRAPRSWSVVRAAATGKAGQARQARELAKRLDVHQLSGPEATLVAEWLP